MPKALAVVSQAPSTRSPAEKSKALEFQSKHEASNDIKSSPRPTTIFYFITLGTHIVRHSF